MLEDWHISRGWTGGDKEVFPECICEEAGCGYVIGGNRDCPQHSFRACKTIRSSHRPDDCPAKEDENAG